jgi:hypothetical protein
MTKELLQHKLIAWFDSGSRSRVEFMNALNEALAQQQPVRSCGTCKNNTLPLLRCRRCDETGTLDNWEPKP